MKGLLLATSAIVSITFAALPANAQDASVPQAVEAEQEGGLTDIIVTAQRTEQSSQRAAVALNVISAADLAKSGINSAAALNASAPALYVTQSGGVNTSYFIRGVGNFTNNGYSDPAIAFNVDGVYVGRPGSTIGTFYDLERVEVLKGPQGTLYGRNATGGAVNVLTAAPKVGQFSGGGSFSYGNYEAINAEAFVNIPVGNNVAFRVSGTYVDRDGYNADGTHDQKGKAVRLQMLAKVTPELSVRLSGDIAHIGGAGPAGSFSHAIRVTPGTPATATSPANYTVDPVNLPAFSGLHDPAAQSFFSRVVLGGPRINPGPLNRPFLDNDYLNLNAEITLETGVGTFTVIPAYRDSKVNSLFNGPAFRGGLVNEEAEQFSLEARLAGKRLGPVDWLVGGFWYDEDVGGRQNFSQYTVNSIQRFTTTNKSYAFFGRLTLHASETLRVVGGARYTDDKKSFNMTGGNLIQICANPAGCLGGPSVPVALTYEQLGTMITLPTLPGPANSVAFGTTGSRLFFVPITINEKLNRSRLTYRAAVEYDLGPRSLLYASFETGYRSGGFNFSLGRETYNPEFINAWTIGSKNRFLDNRLQLNLEAFYWRYRDQQVGHFGLDSTGGNSYFTENIGRSEIKGIDIDAQFRATQTTLLRGSVQYLDNKLTSFIYNTVRNATSNALPPPVGCPAAAGTAPIPGSTTGARSDVWIVNCSGQPGFNSPKWAFNAGIDQDIPVGPLDVTATVDARYRGNRVTTFEYLAFQNSTSDFTIDASLRVGSEDQNWSVTAFVRNLTNQKIPTISQFAGTTGNVVVTQYAAPRTYGVRIAAGF